MPSLAQSLVYLSAFVSCISIASAIEHGTAPAVIGRNALLGGNGVSKRGAASPDGTCGGRKGYTCAGSRFGNCCSKYNYCGSTSAYCGSGCQSTYGSCGSSGTQTSTTSSVKVSSSTKSSSSPSASSTSSGSTGSCYYWYENISHQGKAPFNSNSTYTVYRNVKDYGAKGDGKTDDTAAINAAITSGNRCAPGKCGSSLLTPAVVYFPAGTYVVSQPIVDYYFTQIIGNPNCMPTIKVAAGFTGGPFVIDADPYQSDGNLGYGATNVFWRQLKNFIFDTTAVPASTLLRVVHWPTGQATSLQNIVFKLSSATGTQHEGIFIESGSGGWMTDLIFNGGNIGANIGSQQFTMRNFTFNGCQTAINQLYDWGWTYHGFSINNCGVGLNMTSTNNGAQAVGSVTFFDSSISNTPIGVLTARGSNPNPPSGGSLILENVKLTNVPKAVVLSTTNSILLAGTTGTTTIAAWGQGHAYNSAGGPTNIQGPITPNARPASLVSNGAYYARSKPQYESLAASQFVSARFTGAAGDGQTDDTAAVQATINNAIATKRVAYFDAGIYKVTSTISIPDGAKIVGESYPVIMSSGSFFADMNNPKPVIQVGTAGSSGYVEWSDMIVSTQGAQAGAVLIEWNLASSTPSGMWDVHTRVGGFAGSHLQLADCPKTPNTTITASNLNTNCIAAFASMHITKSAAGLYMENVWLWVADHDIEDPALTQITIYAGRGLLIESTNGPLWLWGTAVEHHVFYEYQLANTQNIYMGFIQTETAYYQPNPNATLPFPALPAWNDPTFTNASGVANSTNAADGWGLRVVSSKNVFVYGAGLYSFFANYNVHCSDQGNGEACQTRIMSIENSSAFNLYDLSTVGVTKMITLDGKDIATYSDNLNGFVDTLILFRV